MSLATLGPYVIQTMPFSRGDQLVLRAIRPDLNNRAFDVNIRPKTNEACAVAARTTCAQQCRENETVQRSFFQNELWVREHLPSHPHLLIALDAFEDEHRAFLVHEARDIQGDLLKYVASQGRLSEPEARDLFEQIVEAVAFCHHHNVVHRDIKLPVLLLDSTCKKIYLSGFRYAEVLQNANQLLTDRRGSPAYVSPEMLQSKMYSGQCADIWSLGVVLFVMLCGTYPFVDRDPRQLFEKIMHAKINLPQWLSPNARDLLNRLLCRNPMTRATLQEVMTHPWMRSARGNDSEQCVPCK